MCSFLLSISIYFASHCFLSTRPTLRELPGRSGQGQGRDGNGASAASDQGTRTSTSSSFIVRHTPASRLENQNNRSPAAFYEFSILSHRASRNGVVSLGLRFGLCIYFLASEEAFDGLAHEHYLQLSNRYLFFITTSIRMCKAL